MAIDVDIVVEQGLKELPEEDGCREVISATMLVGTGSGSVIDIVGVVVIVVTLGNVVRLGEECSVSLDGPI